MTATKIPPISLYKLRQSNIQYKNNKNKNINQPDNYAKNNNDISPQKTTSRQHSIQPNKYGTISHSQMKTKHIQSEPKTTTTTKHMTNKSNASTSKKCTNKNIPNELLQFQRHKNNTGTLQNSKINADNEKKTKCSLHNNGQNKKNSPSHPVPTTTEPLHSKLQQRLTHDRKSIPPTKSNPMAKIFATTKPKKSFSFFRPIL